VGDSRTWQEEIEMRARRTLVFLVASLTAIALAVGGCGDSPSDDGSGSANPPSNESPSSSGGYGY
jgi:putative aminopeptidase FrvX